MAGTPTQESTQYTFSNVQTWSNQIQHGWPSLEELYIPINKNRNHWMVARVLFRERRVEIWDSLGPDPATATYLANILHYIYDATTLTDNSPPPFSDWARRWTTTDKSHLCPRQSAMATTAEFSPSSIPTSWLRGANFDPTPTPKLQSPHATCVVPSHTRSGHAVRTPTPRLYYAHTVPHIPPSPPPPRDPPDAHEAPNTAAGAGVTSSQPDAEGSPTPSPRASILPRPPP